MSNNLLTMHGITASIGVEKSADAWQYAPLGEGIDNLAEALNETVQQYFYLNNNGYATNHVTAMAPAYTVTGRRVRGDAAQDYIFGLKYKMGAERVSNLKLEYTNAENKVVTITCDCTICNIQEFSGATTDDSAISFELRLDGEPKVETAA